MGFILLVVVVVVLIALCSMMVILSRKRKYSLVVNEDYDLRDIAMADLDRMADGSGLRCTCIDC